MSAASPETAPLGPLRLKLLQLAYLIMALGLGITVWPGLLTPGQEWPLMAGVVQAMLGAMGLLALLGLFRPVEMLGFLLFEMGWKLIWLLRVALPLWREGRIDAATAETLFAVALIVPFALLIPWDLVWRRFFAARRVAAA